MNKKLIKALIVLCCTLLTFLMGLAEKEEAPDTAIALAESFVEETAPPTPTFSVYYCTKEEFISYCLEHHIRPDKIEYVWDLLRGQYSVDELANKYYLEYDTIKRDRWKYKKKLLKPIDKKSRK